MHQKTPLFGVLLPGPFFHLSPSQTVVRGVNKVQILSCRHNGGLREKKQPFKQLYGILKRPKY